MLYLAVHVTIFGDLFEGPIGELLTEKQPPSTYSFRPAHGGGSEMDTLNRYREILERLLTDYAKIPYAYGEIQTEAIFDRAGDHYLLVNVGWDNSRRVHGCLVHIDIISGKVWIQRDGTEEGVAALLEEAGVARTDIVLGFRPPEIRKYTDYAVA
jgi:hypothetical protein